MERFNWLDTLRICLFMLRGVGLWPKETKRYGFNGYTFYAFVVLTIFPVINLSLQITKAYFVISDPTALVSLIYILPAQIIGIIKGLKLIFNQPTLCKFVDEINSDVFQPKNLDQKKLIGNNLKQWQIIFLAAWLTAGGSCLFFMFSVLRDKSEERKLIFLSWFPYNYEESPFYQITYIYQSISISVIAMVNTNIGLFLSALNMYTGCQFDLLCDNLRKLKYNHEHKLLESLKHYQEISK